MGHAAPAPTTVLAAQQLNPVSADHGRVVLLTVLFPLPGLQTALDIDLLALHQILSKVFSHRAPDHAAVPLGLFFLWASGLTVGVFVSPHFSRRHTEGGHGESSGRVFQFGITA